MNQPLNGPEAHFQFGSYFSPAACKLITWSLNLRYIAERIERRYRRMNGISLAYMTAVRCGHYGKKGMPRQPKPKRRML
jgi:hypothetical protein